MSHRNDQDLDNHMVDPHEYRDPPEVDGDAIYDRMVQDELDDNYRRRQQPEYFEQTNPDRTINGWWYVAFLTVFVVTTKLLIGYSWWLVFWPIFAVVVFLILAAFAVTSVAVHLDQPEDDQDNWI